MHRKVLSSSRLGATLGPVVAKAADMNGASKADLGGALKAMVLKAASVGVAAVASKDVMLHLEVAVTGGWVADVLCSDVFRHVGQSSDPNGQQQVVLAVGCLQGRDAAPGSCR